MSLFHLNAIDSRYVAGPLGGARIVEKKILSLFMLILVFGFQSRYM